MPGGILQLWVDSNSGLRRRAYGHERYLPWLNSSQWNGSMKWRWYPYCVVIKSKWKEEKFADLRRGEDEELFSSSIPSPLLAGNWLFFLVHQIEVDKKKAKAMRILQAKRPEAPRRNSKDCLASFLRRWISNCAGRTQLPSVPGLPC